MATNFNASNVITIHKEINEALAAIAAKHGLTNLTTGTLRYSPIEMTLGITGKIVPVTHAIVGSTFITGTSVLNMDKIQLFGLIGKEFKSNGETFTITDIKSSRPKFPISAKNAFGQQYKFSKAAVERGKTW
jgi:hypothetical protein